MLRSPGDREVMHLGAFIFSFFALILAVTAFALAGTALSNSKDVKSVASGADAGSKVTLTEFKIDPVMVVVAKGGSLAVTNAGTVDHNLAVKGTNIKTAMLKPGESASLNVGDLKPGNYTIFCEVAGHEAAGMKAMLMIGAQGAPSSGGTTSASGGAPAGGGGQKINFAAGAPAGFKARDPNAPATPSDTVHNLTMHIKEIELEVAPGVKQTMWTFDGQVPGPVYRGKVGDTFNITIINDGKMTHSLDFHAGMVSPNVAMVPIEPGKSHVYSFVAHHAGIFMYHCGTPPVLLHISSGMYGALIIDPPDLPKVDREFVFLQSELYTGPKGQVPDIAKLLNEQYDAVMFNGYVNQYKDQPIRVEPNQRIRVWVLDDGPSQSSSFHVIGTIFDTVYKEGQYLLQPGPGEGGSQALDLQAAQGGFVTFTPTELGNYPFVTHKFNDASRGALGIFQVGDVPSAMSH